MTILQGERAESVDEGNEDEAASAAIIEFAGRARASSRVLARSTRAQKDGALLALALGVLMVSTHGSSVDLMQLLFGSILAVDDAALLLIAGGQSRPRSSSTRPCQLPQCALASPICRL